MLYLGIDAHKRFSQIAVADADGKLVREARLPNTRDALEAFLKDLPRPLKGVVESSMCWT